MKLHRHLQAPLGSPSIHLRLTSYTDDVSAGVSAGAEDSTGVSTGAGVETSAEGAGVATTEDPAIESTDDGATDAVGDSIPRAYSLQPSV